MEKTTVERGKFKKEIHAALFKNSDLKELLLGDTTGMSAAKVRDEFKAHVKSHLFIDDTMTEQESFIFYDVRMPSLKSQVKSCNIIMYLISHREILEDYSKEGYYGDRSDIMAQMVEDSLINNEDTALSFGIGRLNLDSIEIYNSTRYYGCMLSFSVPNFR